jgi:Transglycosylase-like domain
VNRTRLFMLAVLVGLLILLAVYATALRAGSRHGCNSKRCHERVQKRDAHAKWSRVVRAYGVPLLRARMRCESLGDGGYSLYTTNGVFYFGHQFEPRAWYGAGGRQRGGRPVGVWSRQPSALEQDYRAVTWERIHGGDPWPNC